MYLPAALYVRILPIDKQVQQSGKDKEGIHTQPHSTFFIQSLFFLLVFAENLLLALWPLIKGQSNRALACLGPEKLVNYVWIVAGLCAMSWMFHILYYKYMGHPWTEINGPQMSKMGIRCNVHLCGQEKRLTCHWCGLMKNQTPCSCMEVEFQNCDSTACSIAATSKPFL